MNDHPCAEDPDPLRPGRTGTLFVPVRPGPAGCCARLFRTPLGERTAVAFTGERQLVRALGGRQHWIRLSEPAVRALTAPLGVTTLVVDPLLAVPGPAEVPGRPVRRTVRRPRPAGAPSLTATSAS
ncbi:SAV_915 family protein [Streptomyces sp. NPDC058195]|uniref:SAV_915 family protein n=1 Tax=Streptomyces sp. NPDC058195 TaxID=3346375 RepID=UPI0036E88B15